ncbi:MAG: hypothetical protein ACE1YX_03150 [Nitrosopumilaceae archaeon]|nr:MAG: putative membrane SNARE associated-like protein [Nitrosopumilales archaeon]GFN39369.1 MAG: putative membrane SNARE associated-like protein [Marine Group I thaumarchaeote]
MIDILDTLGELSYFGIFLLLIGLNVVPILVPPTWLILATFHSADSSLDPIILAFVGATGSLIGRSALMYLSRFFRRFLGDERKSSLDTVATFLKKRYGFFITSFLFASSPLPSNMLFIAYGIMKAKSIGLFVGFWMGRVISYYVMISLSQVALVPFLELFENRIVGIIIADFGGLALVVFFASINWKILLTEKKLKFVKPRLWRF